MSAEPVLLERIAAGDREALTELYEILKSPLYNFLISRLNDPATAADLLHDVFLEVWRSAGRFEGRSRVKTWVFGIAWRKVADHFRHSGRFAPEEDMPELADDSPGAEARLIKAQDAAAVRHCIEQLKPDHRAAIELVFREDLHYREVAAVMDIPVGTAKSRVFHARRLLQHCLEGILGRRGGGQ